MEEMDLSEIPNAADGPDVKFSPFGTKITPAEVEDCLSANLYRQLSDGNGKNVENAIDRAETYIGSLLNYKKVEFNLDSKVVRQIVLMQTIYELHMSLGHEEAGREYRSMMKTAFIAAFGSFPDSSNSDDPPKEQGAAISHPNLERHRYRNALKIGERFGRRNF